MVFRLALTDKAHSSNRTLAMGQKHREITVETLQTFSISEYNTLASALITKQRLLAFRRFRSSYPESSALCITYLFYTNDMQARSDKSDLIRHYSCGFQLPAG